MNFGRVKYSLLLSLVLVSLWASAASRRTTITPQPLSEEDTQTLLQAIVATDPIPADEAPTVGNFYSAKHGAENHPPMPGNMGLDVWALDDDVYLINDLDQDVDVLLTQTQTGLMTASLLSIPSPGDSTNTDIGEGAAVYTNNGVHYTFDTNGLWLEITNVSSGYASGNLNNATNLVYAILGNTNLLHANWEVEQAIWPGTNLEVSPFTVSTLDRQNLFLRTRDWTGVTHDGNTTPDWWF